MWLINDGFYSNWIKTASERSRPLPRRLACCDHLLAKARELWRALEFWPRVWWLSVRVPVAALHAGRSVPKALRAGTFGGAYGLVGKDIDRAGAGYGMCDEEARCVACQLCRVLLPSASSVCLKLPPPGLVRLSALVSWLLCLTKHCYVSLQHASPSGWRGHAGDAAVRRVRNQGG